VVADSPRNHATNIPGLYACGECDYAYHGANRLGANSLLSASYSGRVAGEAVASYLKGLGPRANTEIQAATEVARQEAINRRLMASSGDQNPYALHEELGELMTTKVGVVRDNAELDAADAQLQDLRTGRRTIQGLTARALYAQGTVTGPVDATTGEAASMTEDY
jgi:succinate dehydrogenase / fumarate reductase flavoprotein subunit